MGCGPSSSSSGASSPAATSSPAEEGAKKNVKLTYFDGRGRGETSRLLLNYAGVEFEDNRVSFADWAALKSKTPWGTLPILEVDGHVLGQSAAVARFIANMHGLAGSNLVEAAIIDSVCDACADVLDAFVSTGSEKDEEKKKEQLEKFWSETVPTKFEQLENILKKNNNGKDFFATKKISWADIRFYDLASGLIAVAPPDVNTGERFPVLHKMYLKVESHPKIAAYVAKRPVTDF